MVWCSPRHQYVAHRYAAQPAALPAVVKLWVLRILVPLGGHRRLIGPTGFDNDMLAAAIGLRDWIEPMGDFDAEAVRKAMRAMHRSAESRRHAHVPTGCLKRNVERLSSLVGLSDVDTRILAFAVMLQMEPTLSDAAECLGSLTSMRALHAISTILGLPESDIRSSLHDSGALVSSGLACLNRAGNADLHQKLTVLSGTFADLMVTSSADPVALLRDTVTPAPPAELGLDAYDHIAPSLKILRPYLHHALETKRIGVNVFIHGAPGTGKSQLTRALAAEMGCELFEVSSEDSDGDPVGGAHRLRAFRAAQSLLAKRRALIVFDEPEDIFDDGSEAFGRRSTAQIRKAWMNRSLEQNPVPTLWPSNSINGLDSAFIRRFDMVFELPVPPLSQRRRIIAAACDGLIDEFCTARLAESDALAPAVVTRAAAVVRAVGDRLDGAGRTEAIEHLVGNILEAQRHARPQPCDPARLPQVYDPAFVRADADLAQLAGQLRQKKSARLCLYGPPGTGKTAYARWLARQLDMPLLVRHASDLLSPYVGQCEIHIARAFRQATQDGALLLLDEIDGLLRDRHEAIRSWEVTQVNELLTQMESFGGVFVASTNMIEQVDRAALRRFDLKVKFDCMMASQALALLCRLCAAMELGQPDETDERLLSAMRGLTPGDFATIARQHEFRPVGSAAQLIALLRSECDSRSAGRSPIGFHS